MKREAAKAKCVEHTLKPVYTFLQSFSFKSITSTKKNIDYSLKAHKTY